MPKKILTTVLALAVAAIALGGCIPTATSPTTKDEVMEFTIVSNAEIGDTDNYGSYNFSIYLDKGQELSLDFYADGAPIRIWLYTPEETMLGYNTSDGTAGDVKDIGLGTLQENKRQSTKEGHFLYEATATGDYLVNIQSSSPQAEIDVRIEYDIN